jgi:ribokinase
MRAVVIGNYVDAHFLYVDRLPRDGESLAATRHFREDGGKGLNLAVGLHRLGVKVETLMAVGRDAAGDALIAKMVEMGMSVAGIQRVELPTGVGVGFITPDGPNFLAAYQGANAQLDPGHIERNLDGIDKADWLLAQLEAPEAAVEAAFRRARDAGAKIYLNPSPWRDSADALVRMADVLVINEIEAACYLGVPEAAGYSPRDWQARLAGLAAARRWQGDLLAVTLGARGAVALDATGATIWENAFPIEQIDPTGAGDAFGCGLVMALMSGDTPCQALRVANACGAIIAASEGILAHLPDRETLNSFAGRATRES